jgi:hypothetical protein
MIVVNKNIIIAGILLLFISVRLFNLSSSVGFGSDEGRDFLTTWNMYQTKQPKLIGPPSEYSINGRQFYFGPAPYYVILPALVVGNWDPLWVSYFIIGLNAVALLVVLLELRKQVKDAAVLYSFAAFCTVTPAVITYTRSYWNPHFMFPVSLLVLVLLLKKKVSHPTLYFSGLGFLFGLGMQFHYGFVFAIIISLVWLCKTKVIKLISLLYISIGFLLGVLPLLLFELRSNFYNLRTFLLVLAHINNSHTPFGLRSFYFISLLPFVFLLLSLSLKYVKHVHRYIPYAFISLFVISSFLRIFFPPHYVLDYPTLQELSNTIQSDDPEPGRYNIVDQLTRDNRAMALRYLVTVKGYTPLGVEEYPQSQVLYVYTKEPLDALLKYPIYELQSDLPLVKDKQWKMQNGIMLYRLHKQG